MGFRVRTGTAWSRDTRCERWKEGFEFSRTRDPRPGACAECTGKSGPGCVRFETSVTEYRRHFRAGIQPKERRKNRREQKQNFSGDKGRRQTPRAIESVLAFLGYTGSSRRHRRQHDFPNTSLCANSAIGPPSQLLRDGGKFCAKHRRTNLATSRHKAFTACRRKTLAVPSRKTLASRHRTALRT